MLNLTFISESNYPEILNATEEYKKIWGEEGEKIQKVMEEISGLEFKEKEIKVIIYEGISESGSDKIPMKLRASYPLDTKKATLIHELAHKLISQIKSKELDEHRILFLILYDIWAELYGKLFAEQQVDIESKRKGFYDYESAWRWALSSNKEERIKKFNELL